jgi:ribulose-phosphate 3-epimerase
MIELGDFSRLPSALEAVLGAGIDGLHLEVIKDGDNQFWPFNVEYISSIMDYLKTEGHAACPVDAHLSVNKASPIVQFKRVDRLRLTIPYNAFGGDKKELLKCLDYVRSVKPKRQAGLAFFPTDIRKGIDEQLLLFADYLVVECSDPKSPTPIMPSVYQDIKCLSGINKMLRMQYNARLDLMVAGGVTEKNAGRLMDAGADVLVLGRALFESPDFAGFIKNIRDC